MRHASSSKSSRIHMNLGIRNVPFYLTEKNNVQMCITRKWLTIHIRIGHRCAFHPPDIYAVPVCDVLWEMNYLCVRVFCAPNCKPDFMQILQISQPPNKQHDFFLAFWFRTISIIDQQKLEALFSIDFIIEVVSHLEQTEITKTRRFDRRKLTIFRFYLVLNKGIAHTLKKKHENQLSFPVSGRATIFSQYCSSMFFFLEILWSIHQTDWMNSKCSFNKLHSNILPSKQIAVTFFINRKWLEMKSFESFTYVQLTMFYLL